MKPTWLSFVVRNSPIRKTKIWEVRSHRNVTLGDIKWFARWRQYALFPEPGMVFNVDCLGEVRAFIEQAMSERHLARR